MSSKFSKSGHKLTPSDDLYAFCDNTHRSDARGFVGGKMEFHTTPDWFTVFQRYKAAEPEAMPGAV